MTLIKKFRKSKDDDYEHMSAITGSMRIVLKSLKDGRIPNEAYSEEDLILFCRSLIISQESDGRWSVNRKDYVVAEEDEVDFIFFPTQIACSILSFVRQNCNYSELKGIDEAIAKGLSFSVSKKLEGYGFNSMFQKIESLIIFIEGSVHLLLNKDPRICSALYNRIIELKEEFQELVDSKNTRLEFGGDYKEQYEFVLNGLADI